jgi:putative FmdB family regulatory protein
MPIYEYQCQDCGQRTEALQRMSDPPLTTCPHCNGPLKKLISAPAFQFKGSGWYVTDYAKGGSAGKEGGKSAGGESGGEKGSEGKPSEKADKSDKKEGGDSGSSAKEAPAAPAAKPAGPASGD